MMITVEVSISENIKSDDSDVPETALLQNWVVAAYLNNVPAIASILVTDINEMQLLNKQYRDKDEATNVLSFPMQLPVEDDVFLLGDIALCAPVIKREADQQAKSEMSHWAHMVVHGMLHLQGYDHINNDEAEEMERMEIKILKQLGFSDPYNQAYK